MTVSKLLTHQDLTNQEVKSLIKSGSISYAGNKRLKIYGRLNCTSGKRMKRSNRVFFITEDDALNAGFRSCGHCMKQAYKAMETTL